MKSIFVLRLGPLDGELVSRAAACLVSVRPESAVAVGGWAPWAAGGLLPTQDIPAQLGGA